MNSTQKTINPMPDEEILVIPVTGFPIVKEGDNLCEMLLSTMKAIGVDFQIGDILVVSHTVVSIVEGRTYAIVEIVPSDKAKQLSQNQEHTAYQIEMALQEATEIIREEPVLITKSKQGLITDYSGVDESNAPEGRLVALPEDADATAKNLYDCILKKTGLKIPVIIVDTQGRPWRRGAVNIAIGVSGMSPFVRNKGKTDIHGKILQSSLVCIADEIAASTELVMGQADEKIPIAIVRGVEYTAGDGNAKEILRPDSENIFR